MKYDFDRVIERRGSGSLKWDDTERYFGVKDIMPLWVADMDFQAPGEVRDAIEQRAAHGIFGYCASPPGYHSAQVSWLHRRFDWQVEESWITTSPGVIPALNMVIRTFTAPGDKIIIQPPVYYPFFNCIENNGRTPVLNPLRVEGGRYTMDYKDLEEKIDPQVKALILCSPHNPVGRVWQEKELRRLAEICRRHKVLVVSDEIHSDLVLTGRHTPFPALGPDFAPMAVVLTSTSKTFNLAGLQVSNTIICDPELRRRFRHTQQCGGFTRPNIFGQVAVEAAYTHGEAWLEELLAYLKGNLQYFTDYVGKHMPDLKIIPPEGTYLVWMDCNGLGMDDKGLKDFLLQDARVGFSLGHPFGPGGQGFVRVNIACPRAHLREALERLRKGLDARGLARDSG